MSISAPASIDLFKLSHTGPAIRLAGALLAATALMASVNPARAQNYPSKSVHVIVASPPGTSNDAVARIIAPELAKSFGQPFVVENKIGASDRIAYEYVATQVPADGYTISVLSLGALVSLPLTSKDLTFDPVRDLPSIIILAESKLDLTATPKGSLKTFDDLVSYAKSNPGKLNYGSSSATTRVQTEMILRNRGLDVVYVPFSSTAANIAAVAAGETQLAILPEANALSAGLVVLAQSGEKRSPNYPNAPTFPELGLPQVTGVIVALNVPAKTPKAITDKLFAAAAKAVKLPDVKAQLNKVQMDPGDPTTPEDALRFEGALSKSFAAVAQQIGLQPQ